MKPIKKTKPKMRKVGIILAVLILLAVIIRVWPQKSYQPYIISPELTAKAEAYNVPSMPEGWTWGTYTASDGAKLRFGTATSKAETPKGTLVYVPGFKSALEMLGEPLSHWHDQGYMVAGLDPRGQGGSQRLIPDYPEKPGTEYFTNYTTDLADFLEQNFKDAPRPLIMVGSSFGAHVIYRTVGHHQIDTDGLVLIAPAYKPKTAPLPYGGVKVLVKTMRVLGKADSFAAGKSDWAPISDDLTGTIPCSTNPARMNIYDAVFIRDPSLRVGAVTNRWLDDLMKSSKIITKQGYADKVTLPVSMVFADHDTIIETSVAQKICDELTDCVQATVPDTGHCLMFEADPAFAQIYKSVDELSARLSQP